MKKIFGVLGGSLFVTALVLVSLLQVVAVSAHSASTRGNNGVLPLSPISTGVLVAEAVHTGTLQPISFNGAPVPNPTLTCSPAPCILPNVQASGGGMPVNEDPIVVNPVNANQLLTGGNDYNCTTSLQGFYASSNGGTSWSHTCMNTLSGQFGCGDPGVGYDLNNTAYITGIDSTNSSTCTPGKIVFEKSTNNGGTWSAPAIAVQPLFPGGITDKDWLQIDTNASSPHKNALYISVTQFSTTNNSEISVSHSTNGGSTWVTKAIDTQQVYPNIDQFSDLAVGKDGTVYASWMRCTANGTAGDCGGTTATMVMSKSTDGGNTWSSPVPSTTVKLAPDTCGGFYGCLPHTSERVSNIPAIDVDNSTGSFAGHLYVVTYNYTGTFMQVQVSTSTNGGTTWGAPVHVAPSTVKHDQFFPWLTVSPGGKVGVTWLDRRNDPSNISYEAFETVSTNGGTSFSTNHQIATTASNPNNDGFGGTFMGDYTGNYWANANTLYASWMDSRNGTNMQDEVGGILL